MKIDINKIKLVPEKFGFNFCQFGDLELDVKLWADYWGFKTVKSGPYTNILINNINLSSIFNDPKIYKYVDGFSPNLNKNLHVGHLSNLIIANSLQKLGIGENFVAILGDTLEGSVSKNDAFLSYKNHCNNFGYKIDNIFYASDMELKDDILVDGEGDYLGSKIFDLGDEKIVGIKSSGKTSYFYQDVALAQNLNASTLYLTGLEQENHFKSLKKIYDNIHHLCLGLVLLDGKKMSSSEGNVIYLSYFIESLMNQFDNNIKLVYNILAGQILKSAPNTSKSIDTKLISNPKLSLGLYISYTMAHILSCGVEINPIVKYKSKQLEFAELKSKINLTPNILFEEIVKHCKIINSLYAKNRIKGNSENMIMFSELISDLNLALKNIGMFSIEKV